MKKRLLLVVLMVVALLLTTCGSEPEPEPTAEPTPTTEIFQSPVETPAEPSDVLESPMALPNPASVYCEEQGGTLEFREEADGTAGYCIFPDGSECEEWAYYRGECEPGTSEE